MCGSFTPFLLFTKRSNSSGDSAQSLLTTRFWETSQFRSRHWSCSIKTGVLKKIIAKITGKYLCQSFFFHKVAILRPATLLKDGTRHSCFPLDFADFFRTPFLH